MTVDVIVIGGGIIGSAITYHLAKDQVKVMQLEQGSIANEGGASKASAGGIRLNNRDPRELALAKDSIKRWATLEDELNANLEYHPLGQLVLFDQRYNMDDVEKQIENNQLNGIKSKIVTSKDLYELAPGLTNTVEKAIYYPSGGQANAYLTTIAYSNAARRLGAKILIGTKVLSIVNKKDKVIGVNTSKGFLASNTVINAAGAWAPELHKTLGLNLNQIIPNIRQMSATYPAPLSSLSTPTISSMGTKISLKQTIDGRIRAGGGYIAKAGPNEYYGKENKSELTEQRKTVLSLFPKLKKYDIDFTYHGVEADSIDHIPVLSKVLEVEGYIITTGFSGHGFTLAPTIGKVISEIAQGKEPSINIDEFSIDRKFETKGENIFGRIRNIPG